MGKQGSMAAWLAEHDPSACAHRRDEVHQALHGDAVHGAVEWRRGHDVALRYDPNASIWRLKEVSIAVHKDSLCIIVGEWERG